ncbi:MAG: hypothetical protein NZ805_11165 [Armatimonadetes bacterium]|nr:hypothetical protein [Armatimonadota bacterium]
MAERRNFHDTLEPIVYLNSSFVIAQCSVHDPSHHECAAFFDRLQMEEVICVVSDFTYNEVAFYTLKQALIREARRTGQRWEEVMRTSPYVFQAAINEVERIKTELDQRTIALSITETARELAFTLMRRYNLLPTQTYNLDVELDAGVNAFVSLDEDLLNVDGIIVHTCL